MMGDSELKKFLVRPFDVTEFAENLKNINIEQAIENRNVGRGY